MQRALQRETASERNRRVRPRNKPLVGALEEHFTDLFRGYGQSEYIRESHAFPFRTTDSSVSPGDAGRARLELCPPVAGAL